ncbi:hypothetical protein ABVF61_07325 [Roseibium sp. HPY-6]|uniref:hypothetical protein n=1 Tax=Roseibium sp. HPY-6 TaxID=3229852 RepID=UPI00338EE659
MAPDLIRKIILASLFLIFAANSANAQSRCPKVVSGCSNHKTCNQLLRDRLEKSKSELKTSNQVREANKEIDRAPSGCAGRTKQPQEDRLRMLMGEK